MFRSTLRRRAFGLFLISLFGASCTVKEDRADCPCLLTVRMEGLPSYPACYLVTGPDGLRLQGLATADTSVVLAVPRELLSVQISAGAMPAEDGRIRIPAGQESPPLYLFCGRFRPESDAVLLHVQLSKQFCALTLKVAQPPGNGDAFRTRIRGQVAGFSADGHPVTGPFTCEGGADGVVRLPRQSPADELWLDIFMPDEHLRSFALGSYIREAGYDWTAPDLQDLTLEINLSVTQITFTTPDWSAVIPLEMDV